MSRIGRLPIPIPAGVKVTVSSGGVSVEGKRGKLSQTVASNVEVHVADGQCIVTRRDDSKLSKSMHGCTGASSRTW